MTHTVSYYHAVRVHVAPDVNNTALQYLYDIVNVKAKSMIPLMLKLFGTINFKASRYL